MSDRTYFVIASGTSVMLADCLAIRATGCTTIVTNTTFRIAPWAHILYGAEIEWWNRYLEEVSATFGGRKVTLDVTGRSRGIESARIDQCFSEFGNSGADAISYAIADGATSVVAIGIDCMPGADGSVHHHGDHPEGMRNANTMWRWSIQFERLARHAQRRGVEIINASRMTALACFALMPLERCLQSSKLEAA